MSDWNSTLNDYKQPLIDDLISILNIPSILDESTASPSAPFGLAIQDAYEAMMQLAKRDNFNHTYVNEQVGYVEYGEGEHYIAVLTHLDVVPATGNWTSPPFAAEIRDNKLFGRGTIDNKGPAISVFYALKILRALKLPTKHRIRLIYGLNEETGMRCMDSYNALEPAPLCGFSPDADFPIIHAEKGQINGDLIYTAWSDDEALSQLVSFKSGTLGNMVPDLATATLKADEIKLKAILQVAADLCQQHDWHYDYKLQQDLLTLSLYGKSTHGMHPHKGEHAGYRLVEILLQANLQLSNSAHAFLTLIHDKFLHDHDGLKLAINATEGQHSLTLNVGVLHYDAEQKEAFIRLNIRYLKQQVGELLVKQILKHSASYHFTIKQYNDKLPHYVKPEHPMIKTLQAIYEQELSQQATLLTTGGGTYACKIKNGVAFGPLFPNLQSTAHQIDEYIGLDDLWSMTILFARAMYELANIDASEVFKFD